MQTGSQNELIYLLKDHLGSTVKAIPEEGSGFSGLSYSAWGETRNTYGTMPTKKQYTGQDLAEIGLYFYQARFYDPSIMQWTSPDTLIPDPYNPLV